MPSFTTADVKRLRELTGAGMLDCKNALTEADGDFDAAVEILRVKYAAKVDKKAAERTAGNGLVARDGGALVELKCETDFVAKNAEFQEMVGGITKVALGVGDVEALAGAALDGKTVADVVTDKIAKIGENMSLRRMATIEGDTVVSYVHNAMADGMGKIGVLVALDKDADIGRQIAMHVADVLAQYGFREIRLGGSRMP